MDKIGGVWDDCRSGSSALLSVEVYVWVRRNGELGHRPGKKTMRLPCVPRVGDFVCADSEDDGGKIHSVYLTDGESTAVCIHTDMCDDPDASCEWWSKRGYDFETLRR